ADLLDFASSIHGGGSGFLALFSGRRVPGVRDLRDVRSEYHAYPDALPAAAAWLRAETRAGRETYAAAHLVRERSRRKAAAAPVRSLWSDVDDGQVDRAPVRPSLVVESSPGRFQAYWRLTRPIEPAAAEVLNKRLAFAIGADPSGFDLSQLLRVPGTLNHKYAGAPTVELVANDPALAHDPDDLDRILPPLPAEKAKPKRTADAGTACGDLPPVVLDAEGMATWRGERPKRTPDGGVDRSASLPKIGRALYDAGATRPTIERALAERDEALGWRKYTDRRDAAEQYAAVVDLLEREGRRPGPTIRTGPHRAGAAGADRVGALEARVSELEAENDALRAEIVDLKRTQSAIVATVTNPHLKAEAATIVRLAADCVRRREKGEQPDEQGFVPVSPAALGEDYDEPLGNGPNLDPIRGKATVNRHLQNLDAAGLIKRELRPDKVKRVLRDADNRPIRDGSGNLVYGEPVKVQKTWVRVTGASLAEVLDPFARYRRPAPKPGEDAPKTHGGKRTKLDLPPCPECGSHHVALACNDCGVLFDPPPVQDETVKNPPPGVVGDSAFQDETRNPSPRVAPDAVAAARADLAARKSRILIAGQPPVPTAAPLHGGRAPTIPGFGASPPDKYTGATLGRTP
ncbi:MAG: hypothetical protein M3Q10_17150, partial [Chloroflexota bacterium]|nr:hypothetical protein [Chloroflexota bacterium]